VPSLSVSEITRTIKSI